VASTFLASPLLIGIKSRNEFLEEDVVYERHGVPVIALETLRNMVVDEVYPDVFADRGGYYVQIDGQIVKKLREQENLSLKDLADMLHVSRKTIYKYETGKVRAHPETAMILENILNMKVTISVNIFKPNKPEKTAEAKIRAEPKELVDLGFGVINTHRTPFDALAKPQTKLTSTKDPLITDLERNRNQKVLNKMATNLKDLTDVIGTDSVFILEKKPDVECIDGIPVVHSWEIEEMKSPAEFLKILAERRECN
jgi:putative transcriptional regulator